MLSGVGQCQRGVELRVVAVPEAGGDRVDVHVLVPRTLEQLQVLHIPWFFAISILSWLFIIFVYRFCDRLAHAEGTCCRGEGGLVAITAS